MSCGSGMLMSQHTTWYIDQHTKYEHHQYTDDHQHTNDENSFISGLKTLTNLTLSHSKIRVLFICLLPVFMRTTHVPAHPQTHTPTHPHSCTYHTYTYRHTGTPAHRHTRTPPHTYTFHTHTYPHTSTTYMYHNRRTNPHNHKPTQHGL